MTARLTTTEVCAMLRISRETLARRVKAGAFPAPIDRGRELLWSADQIDRHLKGITDAPPAIPEFSADAYREALARTARRGARDARQGARLLRRPAGAAPRLAVNNTPAAGS